MNTHLGSNVELRVYESRDDAYGCFQRMLLAGNPSGNWEKLMRGVGGSSTADR